MEIFKKSFGNKIPIYKKVLKNHFYFQSKKEEK